MPHIAGKKIAKSHSTIISEAAGLSAMLAKDQTVTKIIAGPIRVINKGPKRLKIETIPAGLKLTVRGGHACQTIFAYSSGPEALKSAVESLWQKNFG